MSLRDKSVRSPIICYVTDRKSLPLNDHADSGEALLRNIEAAAAAGVDWIQIREKDLTGTQCSVLVREALLRTKSANENREHASQIVINDRLDVALSEKANGVHLGENSLPIQAVRQWLGAGRNTANGTPLLVGVSCHSLETALSAARDGADYLFFGPVFSTPSKAGFGPPQGLARLEEVCASVSIPVLAIGGIILKNAPACIQAGATGIAAIRLFQGTEPLIRLLRDLRATF